MGQWVYVYKELRDMNNDSVTNTFTDHIIDNTISTLGYNINPVISNGGIDYISPFTYIYDTTKRVYAYYLYEHLMLNLTIVDIVREVELKPEISIVFDGNKHKFVGDNIWVEDSGGNIVEYFTCVIQSTIGSYILDQANNYEIDLDSTYLYLNKFAMDSFYITSVVIKNQMNQIVHTYDIPYRIEPMIRIQEHKLYRHGFNNYILFMSFIDKNYIDSIKSNPNYDNYILNFFKVREAYCEDLVPYNIQLQQVLPSTIDVHSLVLQNIKINENVGVQAKMTIQLEVKYNADSMQSKGLSFSDISLSIKLFVLEYLTSHEGINCEIHRTSIINGIKELFPGIIHEVTVISPKTFVVKNYIKILDDNLPLGAWDAINVYPTYFHFDYDNMVINYEKVYNTSP
jgi:hypothetical protein